LELEFTCKKTNSLHNVGRFILAITALVKSVLWY